MKILTVIGARPQFIKAAVISREFKKIGDQVDEIILHTGQHYDSNMSDVFFEELDIPCPHRNLAIGGGTHGQNTGRMLEAIETIVLEEQPKAVLVYGDTDSTLAGALAATKLGIPVVHVEAGLRSFNRSMPEEINRILTDHISDLLLVPTENAKNNLRREGVADIKMAIVGDVMLDATNYYASRARRPNATFPFPLEPDRYILCTIHRAENTDCETNLRGIFEGLRRCGRNVILPLHPRTKSRIHTFDIQLPKNVFITQPIGYLEMTWLEANCFAIATDSGGVQKEAYFHQKPCVTLRSETEWTELVDIGANVLVGHDSSRISDALNNAYFQPNRPEHMYGNGHAGEIIANLIVASFK